VGLQCKALLYLNRRYEKGMKICVEVAVLDVTSRQNRTDRMMIWVLG
jgi:hypothetical protein